MQNQRPPSEGRPIAVFYAGTNGSGKSTLRGLYSDPGIHMHIDPDSIARHLNPNHPRSMDVAAGKKAVEFFNLSIENLEPFTMETTLTGKSIIGRMQKAKDAGFTIELRYIGLESADLNVERVANRVAKGGHYIDEKVIRRRYDESRDNFTAASKIANRVAIWDNSSKVAKLCATLEKGVLEIDDSQPLPNWVKVVVESLCVNTLKIQIRNLKGLPLALGSFTDSLARAEIKSDNSYEP
ncbi:zeta toxin family protein [Pseudomonas sp. S1(2024)]|uniref:zeta toxin family protein n=1 Tax=Pseudomonas sp. S1(2024) TaxID=3390191 RepID=UPI00397C5EB3